MPRKHLRDDSTPSPSPCLPADEAMAVDVTSSRQQSESVSTACYSEKMLSKSEGGLLPISSSTIHRIRLPEEMDRYLESRLAAFRSSSSRQRPAADEVASTTTGDSLMEEFSQILAMCTPQALSHAWDVSRNDAIMLQQRFARSRICISGAIPSLPPTVHKVEGQPLQRTKLAAMPTLDIVPVSDVCEHSYYISTGSDVMDKMFHGGLPCGAITEWIGKPASGKSTVIANVVAASLVKGAAAKILTRAFHHFSSCGREVGGSLPDPSTFISDSLRGGTMTCVVVSCPGACGSQQSALSGRRISELIASYSARISAAYALFAASQKRKFVSGESSVGLKEQDVFETACQGLQFVFVKSLKQFSDDALPAATSHFVMEHQSRWNQQDTANRCGSLLVVDSFSTLVHNSLSADPSASLERHDALAKCIQRLKVVADRHQIAVMLTNFATSPTTQFNSPELGGQDRSGVHFPVAKRGNTTGVFGNTFYHFVNIRLLCDRIPLLTAPDSSSPKQRLHHDSRLALVVGVVKSPVCPSIAFHMHHRKDLGKREEHLPGGNPATISPFHLSASILPSHETQGWFESELLPKTCAEEGDATDIDTTTTWSTTVNWDFVGCTSHWRAPVITAM